MADSTEVTQDNDVNLSDVIKDQSETIETLVEQIKSDSGSSNQPIYHTTPQASEKKSPNYVMYALVGLVAWLMFKKK